MSSLSFTRSSLALAALALLPLAALAQVAQQGARPIVGSDFPDKSGVHFAGTVEAEGPFHLDTKLFFPQIATSFSQKSINPQNPGVSLIDLPDLGVRSPVGGLSNTETTRTGTSFPGVSASGSFPPDPQIAAGPNHIVQVANVKIAWFDKASGNKQFEQSLGIQGFFSGVAANGFVFDPKVFYDQVSQRFFVVALDKDSSRSGLLIAVSDDSNPSGSWNRYRFEVARDLEGTDYWFDYPGWGYNKDGIVATGNMFSFSGNSFGAVQIVAMPKAPFLTGQTVTATQFDDFESFTIQPAHTLDPAVDHVYGASMIGNNRMRVYAFSDLAGVPTVANVLVGVQTFDRGPGGVPTKGGVFIDTLRGRLLNANYRNGHLYVSYSAGKGGQAIARLTDFNIGTWPVGSAPTEFQSCEVVVPGGNHAIQPAVATNSAGDVTVIFTQCGSNIAADVMVASRKQTDPLGQMGQPTLLASSTGTNAGMFGRWGDYFAAVSDPNDDITFWGNAEIVNSNGFWGTWIDSWTVSTGGGGGGGNLGYDPDSVTVWKGTYHSGTVADLADDDDSYYQVNSVSDAALGQAAGIECLFTITEDTIARLEVSASGRLGPGRLASAFLFIYNWDTDTYEYIRSGRFSVKGDAEVKATLQKISGAYVSGSKEIKILVRVHDPFRRRGSAPSPFRVRYDDVNVKVTGS